MRNLFFVLICLVLSLYTSVRAEVSNNIVVEKLETVSANFNKIKSLSARVKIVKMVDYKYWTLEGRYLFKKDVGYRYELGSPNHQVIGFYLDTMYIYSNEFDEAYFISLETADRNTKSIIKILDVMNYDFYTRMKDGFDFEFSHELDGDWVIAAKPKSGWQNLSGIFIKIDPVNNVYKALELYNTQGELFEQIMLNNPVYRGDISVNTQMITSKIVGNSISSDTVNFSGVRINNVNKELIKPDIPESLKILNNLDYDIFNVEK